MRAATLLLLLTGGGSAEVPCAETWHTLDSAVYAAERRFVVACPPRTEGARFGVLVVLDAPRHFRHAAGLVELMAGHGQIPELVVVGIEHDNRTRELLPELGAGALEWNPVAGGAERFARFLEDELLPAVDGLYPTRPERVLFGHSFGGHFAVDTLLRRPATFAAAIAVSPSLRWDGQRLARGAPGLLADWPAKRGALHLSMADEGGRELGGLERLTAALERSAPEGLRWRARVYPDESHVSIVPRALRAGLELVFDGFELRDPLAAFEAGGLDAIRAHYAARSARYGVPSATPVEAYVRLVQALANRARLDEAREVLERDPVGEPPGAHLYAFLGRACLDHGDPDGARYAFARVLELNPFHDGVREALRSLGVDEDPDLARGEVVPELAEAAGGYVLGVVALELALRDDALWLALPGAPAARLTPISRSRFDVSAGDIERLFLERDASGRVAGLRLLTSKGRVLEAARRS